MYLFTYSGPRLRLLTGCASGRNHYYITLWPGQQVCIVSNINTIPPTLNKSHHNNGHSIEILFRWRYTFWHSKKGVFSYNLWRHPNIIWHPPSRLYLWFVTEIKKKGPNKTKGVENILCSLNIFPTMWRGAMNLSFSVSSANYSVNYSQTNFLSLQIGKLKLII